MSVEACTLDCVSFGVEFRLRAESDSLLAMMRQRAPLGAAACDGAVAREREFALAGGEADGYRLIVDGVVANESADLQAMLELLRRELMVHVANYAPDRVFVHAGVVGWRGAALVLPGVSFAGKTTLVAELVRAGAMYYSDEYAVIDGGGAVHPYGRELQMRAGGCVEQRGVSVRELNGIAGAEAIAISHVAFVEYVEGGLWEPQDVSRGSAVLEMMRHSIAVQRTPARVMATLARAVENATAVRSARTEASEAARYLLAAMSDSEALR